MQIQSYYNRITEAVAKAIAKQTIINVWPGTFTPGMDDLCYPNITGAIERAKRLANYWHRVKIKVAPGTYHEDLNLDSKYITIQS